MRRNPARFQEEKDFHAKDMKLWKGLFPYILPQWRGLSLAIVLSFIVTATSLAIPRLVQVGMDDHILNESLSVAERFQGLSLVAAVFLGVILVGFVTNFFQVVTLEWTGQRIMHALRQGLFQHVVKLDLSFFQNQPVGRLVTRLTNDIQNMYEMFTSVIVTLFNDGVRLVGILAIMFWMNWRLSLVLCAIFPILFVITVVFGRLSRDAFRRIRTHLAEINSYVQETIWGMSVIQIFLREREAHREFRKLNDRYYDSAMYQVKIFGIFMPVIEVMSSVAMALIIWYGGGEIIRQHMTLGELTAFISYIRLFFQPLRELSQKYSIVQSALASAERIFQLLETKDRLPVAEHPLKDFPVRGDIRFENVSFRYAEEHPVLRQVSFHVAPGKTLAIVGATGSGKTTIINLLERFYDPWEGRITIDGVDLRTMDEHWLRDLVGLVMQEVFIIPGTIRENILLDGKLEGLDLESILELSQLNSLLKHLPEGLETRVGEGGMDLSAGEKQLLAFARVLARNPRILVLDEATANVDTETEMLIERAIQAALSSRTSLVIAHRLSTIRRADRILVLDQGRIVEEGTHEDLMRLNGVYHHLQSLHDGKGLRLSGGGPEESSP